MGKCSECGKKILYNKYKMYRGEVLCPECYDSRLERKAAKKAERKRLAKEARALITPTKKAKKDMKKKGITNEETGDFMPIEDEKKHKKWAKEDNEDDTAKTSEDSRL